MKAPDDLTSPYSALRQIAADLRNPKGGCPWDIEQTHYSLIENLIEESYEVADAIDSLDPDKPDSFLNLREELGDLLFQVVMHSRLAEEKGHFNLDDVLRGIASKLIHRHPHVYGIQSSSIDTSEVLQNWEILKRSEKKNKQNSSTSLFSSIPNKLPALLKSYRIGQKASRVNFDWYYPDGTEKLFDKIEEEFEELMAELPDNPDDFKSPGSTKIEQQKNRAALEFGDLLFVISQLARHYHINPEHALEQSNKKFIKRFQYMEELFKDKLNDNILPSLNQWEDAWIEAKKIEKSDH